MSDRPIRVLQVVTQMNRGGLESMLMNYYREIDKLLVQFDFLTHRPETEIKDFDKEIVKMGGKIFHLPRLNPFSLSYRKKLNSFLKVHRKDYDIIHVHQDCMSGLILKYAKNNGYTTRIAHSHNSSQDRNVKYFIKCFYKKIIPYYATDLFACSDKAGGWIFGNNKFIVVHNATNCSQLKFDEKIRRKVRGELNIADDTIVIGHVGRFDLQKNHIFIIKIYEEYLKINPNSKLLFVGTGKLQDNIKRMAYQKK